MSRWEEIMATTSASCPSVIPDTLMVKGREIFSCLMGKWSRPPSPHDSTKCSLFCGGPHPGVLWSATVWFITQRKGTHLTYRREPKQLSYRQNTPSDMSPTVICSLFISSCVECNTVDTVRSPALRNPVSAGLTEVFSAAEVTALWTLIRLAADTAE